MLLNLNENEKQRDFLLSSNKTTAILLMEFATGTGKQTRKFYERHPITSDIKWSIASNSAVWEFKKALEAGKVKPGEELYYKWESSPDQINIVKSALIHSGSYVFQKALFFRGGLEYYMKLDGNKLLVKVVDVYSIDSGLRTGEYNKRDENSTTQYGNTKVEFYFQYDWGE